VPDAPRVGGRAIRGRRPRESRPAARLLLLLILLALPVPAAAHQAAMAILEATEIAPGRFALAWENRPTAADGDDVLDFAPVWPPGCASDGALLSCEGDLAGELGFEGLGSEQSAALIRITRLSGAAQQVLLTPTAPTARLSSLTGAGGLAGAWEIARAYASLGFEHILVGVDHLLFVLGLMLLAATPWSLARTITAFTAAHTVSLAAVSFGVVGVPEEFVNAMIALSIVLVGAEIVHARRGGPPSLARRHPELVAFGFGLLHGLGFADALVELGLPEGARLAALLAFNLGVEAGQLLFVAVVLVLARSWREMRPPVLTRPALPVAYAIGGLAAFWFVDRVALMIGAPA
jgi:hydrogenase/urease accessory protein HupE